MEKLQELNEKPPQEGTVNVTPPPVYKTDISYEFRLFLQLAYSLCKQYIAFYEREIKNKPTSAV